MEGHDTGSLEAAHAKAKEWEGREEARIPIGLFYKVEKPSFDERLLRDGLVLSESRTEPDISAILKSST
jgi:2-oxoglutarate ferredoxin oxidoreductase subunit beta